MRCSPWRLACLAFILLPACGPAEDPEREDAGLVADGGVDDSGIQRDAGVAPHIDAGIVDAGPPAPRFETDIAPILEFQCQGCHFVTDLPPRIFVQGDDVRTTFDRLLHGGATRAPLDYVQPGLPEQSYLLLKIEGRHRGAGGAGNHMPPPTARRRVPAEDVEMIRAWIEAGALF